MYSTKGDDIFGCFRCGSHLPDHEKEEEEIGTCPDCGEKGAVSMTQALDMAFVYQSQKESEEDARTD